MNKRTNADLLDEVDTHFGEPGNCLDVLSGASVDTPGIVQIRAEPEEGSLTIDYDPGIVAREDVQRVVQNLSPELQQRWLTCTMRMDGPRARACENCALVLERRLQGVQGVARARASFSGGVISIHYDSQATNPVSLLQTARELGAPVPIVGGEMSGMLRRLRKWLDSDRAEMVFAVLCLLGLLLGFGAARLGWATTSAVAYALAYITGGYYGLQAGVASLRMLSIDVDLLMILAAVGAALVGAPFEGAMLLFLFSLSNVLQNYALDRTRSAISSLMKLRPDTANVRRDGVEKPVSLEQIRVGEEIVIRPGDRVPLDGLVIDGASSLDQSPITGESIPVEKGLSDNVLAGTINQEGALVIRVSRPAGESTLARLIKMVEQAQSEKAKTQRFIDRAEQFYALGVIVMTVLAIVVPLALLDEAFQVTFYRAMTLMVAASPCAVVISTPATVLSAIANGGRRGVLFKGGAYVEEAATIKVVAFDKTGTLTYGKPRVTDVKPMSGESADDLLWLAASLEQKSEHPLAQAILRAAALGNRPLSEASEFKSHTGMGVSGKVGGRQLIVGNERLLRQHSQSEPITESDSIQALQAEGKTVVVVAEQKEGRLNVLGAIGVADVLRESSAPVIKLLKARGVQRVVMLTGDHETVAGHIGEQAGVDEVFAGLMPEDKLRILKELSAQYGPVAMVGDGVNDAPALAAANIGIAMGAAGTDVALETADIVLMADDLANIPYVLALSQKTRRILTQNLIFAFAVILVLVGSVLGVGLALPLSVIGHEGSTVLVSLNGLRMLGFKDSLAAS